MDGVFQKIHDAIMDGEAQVVKELTEEALKSGFSGEEVMKKGLAEGMQAVGQKFRDAEVWIPDVLMASRAMHAGLHVLKPLLTVKTRHGKGKVVIGTVAGDLHDIGKNMVVMMLQGAGYEVIEVGIDAPADAFITAIQKHQPQILGMSALLTMTMPEMKAVIEKIKEVGLRDQIKIIVGGGPVTKEFAETIGADAYAVDAISAVEVINNLMEEEISTGQISITLEPMGTKLQVPVGITVAEACKQAGINLDLPCGGFGKCGKCLVEIVNEGVFSKEKACSFKLERDTVVRIPEKLVNKQYQITTAGVERTYKFEPEVRKLFVVLEKNINREPVSDWDMVKDILKDKDFTAEAPVISLALLQKFAQLGHSRDGFTITFHKNMVIDIEEGNTVAVNYAMAFDIGTTTVVGYLFDNNSGEEIAVVSSINRQVKYGADVISRITAATSDEGLQGLQKEVTEVLNELIFEAASKAHVKSENIYEVVLTGNTTMHHLLLGLSPDNLGHAPFMPVVKEAILTPATSLGINIHRNGQVFVFPVIAGFVGGDTVAVILATNQHKEAKSKLLIDIGTNGELVLGSKDKLITCSTAAGPAFEGARLTWGMRGAPGAIERVSIDDDVSFKTIANEKPKGICGSGIIDLVAEMARAGIVTYKGRIIPPEETEKLPLALANRISGQGLERAFVIASKAETAVGEDIVITQGDIQELQLAKGAIRGAISVLLDQLEFKPGDLAEILLAGAFGSHIDVEKAKRMGLIPDFPDVPVKAIGNAAGVGAKLALLSRDERKELDLISKQVEFVELAQSEKFQSEYIKGMLFGG